MRVFIGAAILCSLATVARAQPAGAISLREQGITDIKAGKLADGCKEIYASLEMWREPSTLATAAKCKADVDHKYATAADDYREVIATAQDDGTKLYAQTQLTQITPKISYIVIRASTASPPGLVIKRDGQAVAASGLGIAIPVDEGDINLEASAPDREQWSQLVPVAESRTVEVTVPDLPRPPTKEPEIRGVTEQVTATARPDAPKPVVQSPRLEQTTGITSVGGANSKHKWSYVIGSAGGAALITGIVIGLDARSEYNQAQQNMHCDANLSCDSVGFALGTEAIRNGNIATVVGVAGVVGLGAGAALWFLTRSSESPPRTAIVPIIDSHVGGIAVTGRL